MTWVPIRYRDFWDVPRIFLANYENKLFLFDCPFDDEIEDYPRHYKVYVLPDLAEEVLAGSWAELYTSATQYLGEVPIENVRFDATKRREIDSAVLEELVAVPKAGSV